MQGSQLIDILVNAVVVLVLAAVLFACTGNARAQGLCAPWSVLQKRFAERFAEVPIGGGLVNANTMATVLASPDGASWTIVIVDARGLACAIASGKGWEPGKNPQPSSKRKS